MASPSPQQNEVIADGYSVWKELGVSRNDPELAIATCLVESQYTTGAAVRGVDHGSIGAFQQHPSRGWGNSEDTVDQARNSFRGISTNIGLLQIPEQEGINNPDGAEQQVQRSAYPEPYAERLPEARAIVEQLLGSE